MLSITFTQAFRVEPGFASLPHAPAGAEGGNRARHRSLNRGVPGLHVRRWPKPGLRKIPEAWKLIALFLYEACLTQAADASAKPGTVGGRLGVKEVLLTLSPRKAIQSSVEPNGHSGTRRSSDHWSRSGRRRVGSAEG